ncbi:MAG: carbohydrate porin [Nitrospirae bacterium]|nr:carbohydrate porin [Nitrospirota bacterium]
MKKNLCVMKKNLCVMMGIVLFVITPAVTLSYDVNEKLTIEGTLTGVFQYGDFDSEGTKDTGRGSGVLDLSINFHPTEKDEFQITLSYAAGNALNPIVPFSLVPYADDLEDDLKDINGRNRDYLLEAWYKHTFTLSKDVSFGITGGIIDATVYIDDNSFANDEVSQFMNDTFVNSTIANLPSYDLGGIAELNISNVSVRALFMSSKNEENKEYGYYAIQLGYKVDTTIGEGNYRVYGFTTNDKFLNWDGTDDENLQGFGVSLDQKLGEILGIFARAGWQDDRAYIDHAQLYSGGVNINGKLWGRENDEIGVGYAYLRGVDKEDADIDNTNAIEAYAKFKISDFSDITFDVQYINDNMKYDEDRDGFVYGIRVNAYF